MEYWGNALEGRGLLYYDNTKLQVVDDDDDDPKFSNPRTSVTEWDLLSDNLNTIDSKNLFIESDFDEIITNSFSSEPNLGCLAKEISTDSCKTVSSSLFRDFEFRSNPCAYINTSSNKKSQADFRLRGLDHSEEFNDRKFSEGIPIPSSIPSKKSRIFASVYVCQVYGCNKDLSSSKEYYKRHKVCVVHSKASKVFVDGIQQRFCQQCSKFHVVAEFDDGKRSCRKRLAGHNLRRRKPYMIPCSRKSYRSFAYSQGHSSALSLLSADQWHNISTRSSASIPTAQDHFHHCLHHQSSSANECSYPSVGPYFNRFGTHMLTNAGGSHGLESINGGPTVNLNQLSAHLERVEQQKNFMLVKPENYIFC